ncbi:hypothetical protein DPMN_011463 [Dreissena polymorpha]|uniref:Secreted protein n=1 Tax=Dreissena polymorpha TaxID=45954 RepID=A0A9D4S098_DREPO|nr:hypothetical protein DPMN_011463 [Dreissena polymorpha]
MTKAFWLTFLSLTNQVFQIICDGARLYAHKVQSILERNCYFDNNHKAEFDVNDRVRKMGIQCICDMYRNSSKFSNTPNIWTFSFLDKIIIFPGS